MGNTLRSTAFWGGDTRRPTEGVAEIGLAGFGARQTLSIQFIGRYTVLLPLRAVTELARAARTQPQAHKEQSTQIDGHCTRPGSIAQKGRIAAWFSIVDAFEMLTVEYGGLGQISVPYRSIEQLLRGSGRFPA